MQIEVVFSQPGSIGLAAVSHAAIHDLKSLEKVLISGQTLKKNDTKSKCHKSDDLCKMATRNNLTIKVHSDIFILCDKKKGGKENVS